MKMTKRKTALLVVLAVAIASLGSVALRAVPRWLAVRKILSSPERFAMLAVTPEPKIQVAPPDEDLSPPIDIGYAEFSLPAGHASSMTSRGHGEAVVLESDPLSLGILAPADVDTTELLTSFGKIEDMGRMTKAEWVTKRLLSAGSGTEKAKANMVDMQLLAAEAKPLPFATIFMMNHAEFKAYLIKLIMKTMLSQQAEQIVPYEAPHSVGVIYVREGGQRGIVELTTHDRRMSQVVTFKMAESEAQFPGAALSAFLATYRFTIQSCPSREKVAGMIAASGIIPWAPPEEGPAQRDDIEKNLQQYQMDLIRKGAKPLPIPLTQEMDDQLVKEGVLPPRED
jgi:hypothetical protein